MLDTDFHNHVVRSSALQMVQSAQNKGLRVLGLSEHVFQMSEAHPLLEHLPLEGPLLPFAAYIEAVQNAAQTAHFDVRLGLEVDFISQKNAAIQAFLQAYAWDYLIGSVHQIADNQFEHQPPQTPEEGAALWLAYFQLLRAAVSSGFFSVISHPVRMYSQNHALPATFDDELEQLAAEAALHNVALEINGFDTLNYPDIVYRLVRACAAHHTPISVGSDAHNPRQIARAHTKTATLLHELGLRTVRIWKQRVPEDYKF